MQVRRRRRAGVVLFVLLCMFLLSVGLAYGVDRTVRLDVAESSVSSCNAGGLHATWDHGGFPAVVGAIDVEVFDTNCDGALVMVTVADSEGRQLGEAASEVSVPRTRVMFEPGTVAAKDVGHIAVVVMSGDDV